MSEDPIGGGWRFISLKWKVLLMLSLVLAAFNASLAYLVFLKTTDQFEAEQAKRVLGQVRELDAVLSNGFESMSTFAAFIPLLSAPDVQADPAGGDNGAARMAGVLAEHGVMLGVEWGVEGVHYFTADRLDVPAVSWPVGRQVPALGDLLETARRDDTLTGRVVCHSSCTQNIALPLLDGGRTAGFLLIERSIADALKAFHRLSDAEIALLRPPDPGFPDPGALHGNRLLTAWGQFVSGITHERQVLPILQELASSTAFDKVIEGPVRVTHAAEWYEVYAMPAAPSHAAVTVLGINRVTGQVNAIREATTDSLILGLAGLVFSELILLALMWGPMQRIQDVVFALPLLAEKSYARLRHELPAAPGGGLARDEIDVMVGAISAVSHQIEDIDEARSAAEKALRDSEQSLQLAQSMARVAAWVGQPLDGMFRITQGGAQIDSSLDKVNSWGEFLSLVHPDDQSRLRIAWRQARIGSVMDIEFALQIGDREIDVHAMARFDAVDPGRILRGRGMMQDVTELRAAERALKGHRDRLEEEVLQRTSELVAARNEAERLAHNKSRFLANMSHEIRTPMNAVLGLAQIGLQQSQGTQNRKAFAQILDAGEHLLNVVNDVLDYSKLEAGKLAIDEHPFDLHNTLRQCTDMLRQRVDAKSLAMPVTVASDIPQWVVGDGFRLQQILINLLSNAVKFTDQGKVALDVYRDRGKFCFKVSDTGIGMSRDQIAHLFTPYQQGAFAAERHGEGTGLGLSISNTLAIMMHGGIEVHSEPGVGSHFLLRLPLQATSPDVAGADEATAVPHAADRLAGIRALVVDDVSINRTIVATLLEGEGALVQQAADGNEAVAAVLGEQADRFDVILMDVEMPGMNGRDATRRIRDAGQQLPILGVTAHVSPEEHEASLAAGMNDQVVKPIMRDELVSAIRRQLADGGGRQSAES